MPNPVERIWFFRYRQEIILALKRLLDADTPPAANTFLARCWDVLAQEELRRVRKQG